MMNSRKVRVQSGFFLLGILTAVVGCGTQADSSRAAPPAEEGRTVGATACGLEPIEVADAQTAGSGARGAAEARASGGESLEGLYVIALGECLYAGRLTFQDQKIRLTRQDRFSSWAAIDGRFEDATPVRIKGEDLGAMRTKVLFTVGTQKSDYNKGRVQALKAGFEERLLVAGPRNP